MPCVLYDHNYCIEVLVWSSCSRTDYVQRFHNDNKAESYCSWLKCADSEYERTETIQVEKQVEKIEVDLNLSELDALRMTRFELFCLRSTLDWLVRGRKLSLRYLRELCLRPQKVSSWFGRTWGRLRIGLLADYRVGRRIRNRLKNDEVRRGTRRLTVPRAIR